jgi:hypothetical protein
MPRSFAFLLFSSLFFYLALDSRYLDISCFSTDPADAHDRLSHSCCHRNIFTNTEKIKSKKSPKKKTVT